MARKDGVRLLNSIHRKGSVCAPSRIIPILIVLITNIKRAEAMHAMIHHTAVGAPLNLGDGHAELERLLKVNLLELLAETQASCIRRRYCH